MLLGLHPIQSRTHLLRTLEPWNDTAMRNRNPWPHSGLLIAASALSTLPACSRGATLPLAAAGRAGGSLSAQAVAVPKGALLCRLEGALKDPHGAPPSKEDRCAQAETSDELWRQSLVVLSAYGDSLDSLALGAKPEASGALQAELTGVRDADFIVVEDSKEKAARHAAVELVRRMRERTHKTKLEEAVKAASPDVAVLCEGLDNYLAAQVETSSRLLEEVNEKRKAQGSRRCAMLEGRAICVGSSLEDRLDSAAFEANLTAMTRDHRAARDAVAGFCAAHEALAKDASDGGIDADTYHRVVTAVRDAVPAAPPTPSAETASEPDAAEPERDAKKPVNPAQ